MSSEPNGSKPPRFLVRELDVEMIKAVLPTVSSYRALCRAININHTNATALRAFVAEHKLDDSHFTQQPTPDGRREIPSHVLFSDRGILSGPGWVASELIRRGLRPNRCQTCGQPPEWQGKPLTLRLHHLNDRRTDFRLENILLLCPNCHSQYPPPQHKVAAARKEKTKMRRYAELAKEAEQDLLP